MKTHLLRAEWNNIIMANYAVPKELLLPYVPYKTELDFFEGETYVTLAGFMFLNTQMLGFGIPFHSNFEEVALRFYVKSTHGLAAKRGVVFIKEIVPKYAITLLANTVFGQNYITLKMKSFHQDIGDYMETGYEWKHLDKWSKLTAKAGKRSTPIRQDKFNEFIADHYYGFRKNGETKTYQYEVEHELWETFNVIDYSVDCDFGSLFGKEFSILNKEKPKSVFMLKGSEIRIHPRQLLE
jgi:uncharacterized protein YqjF (DUF2071 family)